MAKKKPSGRIQQQGSLEKFPRFPDLPAEIRHMIWSIAWASLDSGPHLVDLELVQDRRSKELRVTTRSPPVLLYVNQESRACLRGISRLEVSTTRKPNDAIAMPKHPIYVDLQRDTFRMSPRAIHCLKLGDLSQIRNLEIVLPWKVETWLRGYQRFYYDSFYNQDFGWTFASVKAQWRSSLASNKRSFSVLKPLDKLIISVPFAFLGKVVITSEDPDWAEQVAALYPPSDSRLWHGNLSVTNVVQDLKRFWDGSGVLQRALGIDESDLGWVPPTPTPKIIFRFFGSAART